MESVENSSPQESESAGEEETPLTTKKKNKNHPRRFTEEQIKSLESIFKLETKLDPRKKLQVARDLGLQPRQVAIWFQNKRARWKSKQIEQEYKALKSSYDRLLMQFDDLQKEKQSLQMQLLKLSGLVKNLDSVISTDHPNSSVEEMNHNDVMINRNGDQEILTKNFDKTEDHQEFISWTTEEEEISQTWHNLSSVGLFDQSSGNSNWWES